MHTVPVPIKNISSKINLPRNPSSMSQGDRMFSDSSTDLWKMWSRCTPSDPIENQLIYYGRATGITTAVVEGMEESFKKDVLRELRIGNGRVLLHDEVEERPGVFTIIPIWETVSEADILTPKDVIELIKREGYRVRLPRSTVFSSHHPSIY